MIRRLTLSELIETAKNLQSEEQISLVAAISDQLAASGIEKRPKPNGASHTKEDRWKALAIEGLSRAYGEPEPEYPKRMWFHEAGRCASCESSAG